MLCDIWLPYRECVPMPSSHSESTEPSTSRGPAESLTAGYSEEEEEEEEASNQGQEQVLRLSCSVTYLSQLLFLSSSERIDSDCTDTGPQVYECEGGGYEVDPATVSNSPIRSAHHTHYKMW